MLLDTEALPTSVELVIQTSASEPTAPRTEPVPAQQLIAIESLSGDSLVSSAQLGLADSNWSVIRWLEHLPSEEAFALDGRFSFDGFVVRWPAGGHDYFSIRRAGTSGDPARITLIGGASGPSTVQGRLSCGGRALRERHITLRYANGVSVNSITDDRGQFALPALCIGDAEIYSSGFLRVTPVTIPKGGVSGLNFDLPTGQVFAAFVGGGNSRHWLKLLIPEDVLAALEVQSREDKKAIDETQLRAVAVSIGRSVGSRTVFEYVPAGRYQAIMIPTSRARTHYNLPSILARSAPFTLQEGASVTAP